MKTYCFRVYHRDIDSDDLIYIGANSPLEAKRKFKEDYPRFDDYDFLGEE